MTDHGSPPGPSAGGICGLKITRQMFKNLPFYMIANSYGVIGMRKRERRKPNRRLKPTAGGGLAAGAPPAEPPAVGPNCP